MTVWGAISLIGKSELLVIQGNLTAVRCRDEILIPHLIPFINRHQNPGQIIFPQDNAPPHRARVTHDFLDTNNINVMRPWPAESPDINPIENLWDHLDNLVRNQMNPPRNPAEMA